MRIRLWQILLVLVIVVLFVLVFRLLAPKAITPAVRIAAWNLQVFGDAKASNEQLLDVYAQKISAFDVVFLQEIRDKDGSALVTLCSHIPNATCIASSRAGRSSSKEQYVVVLRGNASLLSLQDYNPDAQDRWERPPIRALISTNGYNITVYLTHIKPDDATAEIEKLEGLVASDAVQGNIAVLGDFNADCSYYDESKRGFSSWRWVIPNSADTTTGPSDCAYDRIVLNTQAAADVASWGIDRAGITAAVSDHALVWVALGEAS